MKNNLQAIHMFILQANGLINSVNVFRIPCIKDKWYL
jgi:hypothetical protein